jgi:hypothetical protein
VQRRFVLPHLPDGFLDSLASQVIEALPKELSVPGYFFVEVFALFAHATMLPL